MTSPFLETARQGKNGWGRYLLGTLIIALVPITIVLVLTVVLAIGAGIGTAIFSSDFLEKYPIDNWIEASFMGVPMSLFMVFGLWTVLSIAVLKYVVETIHQRRLLTLVNPAAESLDWPRWSQGFIVCLIVESIGTAIYYFNSPSDFRVSFNSEWLFSLSFSLIQSGCLAAFFCLIFFGYWLQGIGQLIRKTLPLSLVYSLFLGTLLSLMAEKQTSLYWVESVIYIAFCNWLVLKENRLELLMGYLMADAFHSLSSVREASLEDQMPALLEVDAFTDPTLFSLFLSVAQIALFYAICFHLIPKISQEQ